MMSVSSHERQQHPHLYARIFVQGEDDYDDDDESEALESQSTQPYHVFPIDKMWPSMFPYHEPTGFSVCAASRATNSASSAVCSLSTSPSVAAHSTVSKDESQSTGSPSIEDDTKVRVNLSEQLQDLHTRQLLDELQIQELYKERDQIDGTAEFSQRMARLEEQLHSEMESLEPNEFSNPPDCEHMAVLHENVARLASSIGRSVMVKASLEKALQIRRNVHGPSHSTVANILHELGDFLDKEGYHKEALERYIEALSIYHKLLGPNNKFVGNMYFKMGNTILNEGFHDQAIDFLQESLKIQRLNTGPTGKDIADILEVMGNVQIKTGNLEDALLKLREALRVRRQQSDKMKLATTLAHIFNLFQVKQEYQVAMGYFEEWLVVMGDLYSGLHESAEAIKFYREALTLRMTLFGGKGDAVGAATIQAADQYFKEGKLQLAQRLCLELIRSNERRDKSPEKIVNFYALLLHGHCYFLRGKTEEAKRCLNAAAEVELGKVEFCVDMSVTVRDVLFKLLRETSSTSKVARALETVKWMAKASKKCAKDIGSRRVSWFS